VEDEVLGELRFCACTGSQIRVFCLASRAEFSDQLLVFLIAAGAYKRVMESFGTEHNNQVVNDCPSGKQGS
jgi:hypothetical protein